MHAARYTINHELRFEPIPSETVNFLWLKDLLLSTDLDRLPELAHLGSNQPKFLDGKVNMIGNNVCFASFPRTGNTFLRRFIEQCTGTTTGSDMPLFVTQTMQTGAN